LERLGEGWVRELVGAGRVSIVLAQDRDRFAHESASLFYLREEFGQHGRKPRALNDRGDDNPEGRLTDGILDQVARFERLKIAEGRRQRKLRKAREGKIVVRTPPGTGSSSMPLEMPTRLTGHRWRSSAASSVCSLEARTSCPVKSEAMWVAIPVSELRPSLVLVSRNA
jgi:hypothetical protein